MKIKNINIGDFIEAKYTHGGDISYDILEVGKSYKVLGFSEDSDLTVIISVPDHKLFSDGFYVCHECFRKPKPQLIERDKVELTGSDLTRAMLARGDKWVMCLVNNHGIYDMRIDEPSVVVSHDENGFYIRDSYYEYAMPVNNQGEPLTAKEVGL